MDDGPHSSGNDDASDSPVVVSPDILLSSSARTAGSHVDEPVKRISRRPHGLVVHRTHRSSSVGFCVKRSIVVYERQIGIR